jgi:hypothetical protein
MTMSKWDKCRLYILIAWFNGGFFGGIAGLFLGGLLGAFLGAIAGGTAGLLAGGVWCWLDDLFDGNRFAVPTVKANLSASPNPVKVGNPCQISAGYNFSGNTDHALTTVTYVVSTDGGNPNTSPPDPNQYSNNAVYGGTGFPVFDTTWAKQSDGQHVVLTIVLAATLNNKTVLVSDRAEVTVVVVP